MILTDNFQWFGIFWHFQHVSVIVVRISPIFLQLHWFLMNYRQQRANIEILQQNQLVWLFVPSQLDQLPVHLHTKFVCMHRIQSTESIQCHKFLLGIFKKKISQILKILYDLQIRRKMPKKVPNKTSFCLLYYEITIETNHIWSIPIYLQFGHLIILVWIVSVDKR